MKNKIAVLGNQSFINIDTTVSYFLWLFTQNKWLFVTDK